MAKSPRTDKAERMLKLLMALRKKPVARVLAAYGFRQETLEYGWTVFSRAYGPTFNNDERASAEPKDLVLLDQWENHWFPIASASLEANFPEVHARVFRNLSQTDGRYLVPSLLTMLERIDALAAGGATEQERAARALVTERGLTDERLQEARDILRRLMSIQQTDDEDDDEQAAAEQKAAEDAMWAFYKEWSTIARTAIKSRRLLKLMGFLQDSSLADKPAADQPEPANGGTAVPVSIPAA